MKQNNTTELLGYSTLKLAINMDLQTTLDPGMQLFQFYPDYLSESYGPCFGIL